MLRRSSNSSYLLIALGLILVSGIAGIAQFRAGVQGTVTDAAGGTVAGATVTLTSKETNQTQTTTTSDAGFYRFTGLAPGLYSIAVEQQGFKKRVINDVKIDAEALQGQDISLEAGGINETVTVQAENVGLETEDANIRKSITNAEVLRLPQVGRDPYELARLAPGVFGSGARSSNGGAIPLPNNSGPGGSIVSIFQTENQVQISANGQRVSANSFQIDGVNVNSQTWGGAAVVTPSQEAVKEVQVSSSSYSAEDGRNSGAMIKVVSQNGTNIYHGSAFFKYADPGLNAFNKFTIPIRVSNKFRQWGGSFGGPLPFPRFGEVDADDSFLRSGKDKLFFFFTYEGAKSSSNVPYTNWIETSQFRQTVIAARPNGISGRILSDTGVTPRVIALLPSSCAAANIVPARCQAVNGGLDVGSPAGATGVYVDPAFGPPGIGGGFDGIPDLVFALLENPTSFRGDQYNTRVDFNATSKDTLTFSTFITPTDNLGANTSSRSRPMADIRSKRLNWAATGIYNRSISTTTFNEFRVSYNSWGYNEVTSNTDQNFGIPLIRIEKYSFNELRWGAPRSEATPGIFKERQFEVKDIFNRVMGNHNVKIGGEWRREMNDNSLVGGARPEFSFVGLWDFVNDAPLFEAINADPTTGAPATGERNFSSSDYALFVQDDWKVRPNLTLNLGLRWEYFAPLTDKSGLQSNLFLGPNGLVDAQVRPVDKLYKPDWNNFAPQVGFAWSPRWFNDKAVVRGGFGIGYNRLPNSIFLNSRANPPFFARFGLCCGTSGSPYANGQILYALGSGRGPDSYPANPVIGQGIDPVSGGPVNGSVEIYGTPQEMPTSYAYRYSLEGQYELPYKLVATLGYQGSAGRHFLRLVNQNFVFAQTNSHFFATYFASPDVNTNYNALNARLQKRLSHGIQFDAIYRFSKSLDNLSNEGPGFFTNQTFPPDNSTEYGPSDYDVRHSWVVSALWDVPFFRRGNSWTNKVLGGWQINGIWTYHTGFPWTPKVGRCIQSASGAGFCDSRPVAYSGLEPLDNTNENFLGAGIFPGTFVGGNCGAAPGCNTAFRTFLNPGPETYINNPPGIGRNVFRGPKYRSLDISLIKRFRLDGFLGMTEGAGLDLRANFFNIFNQLNLDNFQFGDSSTYVDRSQFGRAERGLAGRTVELQARFNF